MSIPGKLVLASADLNARARVLEAAGGRDVVVTPAVGFSEELSGAAILVLDLDEGGEAALEELKEARASGSVPGDVIGFMSHIDRALGRAAREAGCKAVARGRFWSHLAELLEASDPS